ncbi:MAG: hypothetical protein QOE90_1565 [Thermoplasmata archaeon]|jgi:uncharacterized membrane protein|nr:hypothetical protein [Thermoplasmata archaeon]
MPQLIPPHLHPLVVHFPIVLIPLAAALATYAAWKRPAWTRNALLVLMGLAAVSAFVADQLGDHELESLRGNLTAEQRAIAHTHEDLGSDTWVAAAALFAVGVLLRKRLFFSGWLWAYAALLWALFALVAVAAWYGGALVYEQGVGVP